MPTAAALRLEIEHALERKFPAALTPAPRAMHEVAATGIRAVDELLHGGLPVGAISELTGAVSSGRTSLALQFVAQRVGRVRSRVGRGEWRAAEATAVDAVRGK
jgi:RecA/RadA recombinase